MPKSVSELEQELRQMDKANRDAHKDWTPGQAQKITAEALVAILGELQNLALAAKR